MWDIICTKILDRASKADVGRHVDVCQSNNIPYTAKCACISDEDICDNVFTNSENSSNIDSSDNNSDLNSLYGLCIRTCYEFLFFQSYNIWFT